MLGVIEVICDSIKNLNRIFKTTYLRRLRAFGHSPQNVKYPANHVPMGFVAHSTISKNTPIKGELVKSSTIF